MSGDITCGGSLNIVNSSSPYTSLTYLNINNYSNIIGIQFGTSSIVYNNNGSLMFDPVFSTNNIYLTFTPYYNSNYDSLVQSFSIISINASSATIVNTTTDSSIPYGTNNYFYWMAICYA